MAIKLQVPAMSNPASKPNEGFQTLLGQARHYAPQTDFKPSAETEQVLRDIETTLIEADEWQRRQQYRQLSEHELKELEAFRQYLDGVTDFARSWQWRIFEPDWAELSVSPCFSLTVLIGWSVGLHHRFASPNWLFYRALPFFEGEHWRRFPCPPDMPSVLMDIDPPQADEAEVQRIQDCLRRRKVAMNHLAPRGPLTAVVMQGEYVELRLADFVAFARSQNWTMPEALAAYAPAPAKKESTDDKRNRLFRQWRMEVNPDLDNMKKEDIKAALAEWGESKGEKSLFITGFDGWWRRQQEYKGKPGAPRKNTNSN